MSKSRLVTKNIVSDKGSTTIRIHPEFWGGLLEIGAREGLSVNALIRAIDVNRDTDGRTSACYVHILQYFRAAASESGHTAASHGPLPEPFKTFLRPV